MGLGGFTTNELNRSLLTVRAVALIYNWWSLFVRPASPEARREAINSNPWLMPLVGRRTEHPGQTALTLTGLLAMLETYDLLAIKEEPAGHYTVALAGEQ